MTILFPDRTIATLSYPTSLHLAERGAQVTASYSWRRERSSPRDIYFIRGDVPQGLLEPEPLQRFETIPAGGATLHRVAYTRLRERSDYALLFAAPGWDVVAIVPSRKVAPLAARHLHLSVTKEGWPSIFARGPLEMSVGFGEAGGPSVEVGDRDPTDAVDAPGFRYIKMGPTRRCTPRKTDIGRNGRYASKCLRFPGVASGIFMSIHGPTQFVRAVYRGVELTEGERGGRSNTRR